MASEVSGPAGRFLKKRKRVDTKDIFQVYRNSDTVNAGGAPVTINFMVAGDDKYFYLLRENCAHVKARYPEARVIVFDFGLTPGQVASLGAEWPNVEVIDWTAQVDDLSQVRETTPPEQRRKLAIAVNARRTGLAKKIRKFMLKRFPGSATSRRAEDRALWFENLLIQKIQCMKHASTLCAGEPLVFLDAWWAETLATREWLREQTALVRFIHRQAPTLFTPNRSETVALNGIDVNVRMVPCSVYNFNDMGSREPETFPHAKIYHFADRRQEKRRFFPLLSTLKARAEKMAKEKPA